MFDDIRHKKLFYAYVCNVSSIMIFAKLCKQFLDFKHLFWFIIIIIYFYLSLKSLKIIEDLLKDEEDNYPFRELVLFSFILLPTIPMLQVYIRSIW